jgi:hypothetical protein
VTFYVRKSLAHGPIRFGVSPRQTVEEIDSDPGLSTGPAGEFLRRSTHGYFFADTRPIGAPEMPKQSTLASTPFLASLKPEDTKGWIFIGMMILGFIFIILGLGVVMNKGPQGWIQVILGLGLIAAPIVAIAAKRRIIRQQEDKDRSEREERENRNKQAMTAYADALTRLRSDPSEENLKTVVRERENLELSYKHWRPLAKRSLLHIGFDALGRLGAERANEVSKMMNRYGSAIGLDAPDTHDVKLDLYQTAVWHLLADDRLGPAQMAQLETLRKGFDMKDADAEDEHFAIEQFDRLRGIKRDRMPKQECPIELGFRETCIHAAKGEVHHGKASDGMTLYLTNKRVIIDGKRRSEVALSRIDDVEVDVNANVMMIQTARPDPNLRMTVEQPLYTAALIDIATTIDERPKSFT